MSELKRIDLSKYDGHTPGPWSGSDDGDDVMPPDEYFGLNANRSYPNKGYPIIESDSGVYGPYGADRSLIVDAPVLLQALKDAYVQLDRRASPWIRLEDRKPEEGQLCLFHWKDHDNVLIVRYRQIYAADYPVSHWMPIPPMEEDNA